MNELFGVLLIFGIPALLYYTLSFIVGLRLWLNGKVPILMPFNNDNLFEVYIAFAVLLIKSEKKESAKKIDYLKSYIIKRFPEASSHFSQSFGQALKDEPIKISYAARWLKLYLNKRNRTQLIYFLADISMIDGNINKKEYSSLKKLCKRLKIYEYELKSIIAGLEDAHQKKLEEEFYQRERERKTQKKRKPKSSSYTKTKMADILGVQSTDSFEIIKKAYRKLVKLHHPDRFIKNGPEQIKLAQERFIEIQKAYEYFESLR
jgi:DnaJ like chaperone protein